MEQHQKQIHGLDGQPVMDHRLVVYEKVRNSRLSLLKPELMEIEQVCHSAHVRGLGWFLETLHCLSI